MKANRRVLKVGVMPEAQIRARMVAIAKGDYKPAPGEPKVWFTSMKSLAEVMSERNRQLLTIIHEHKPASLRALADLTGRAVSNLSRTLHTFERYGIVEFETRGRAKAPVAKVTALQVQVDLQPPTFAERSESA